MTNRSTMSSKLKLDMGYIIFFFSLKYIVVLAQHTRAPTYQHLCNSCTAGREEMIAFV